MAYDTRRSNSQASTEREEAGYGSVTRIFGASALLWSSVKAAGFSVTRTSVREVLAVPSLCWVKEEEDGYR